MACRYRKLTLGEHGCVHAVNALSGDGQVHSGGSDATPRYYIFSLNDRQWRVLPSEPFVRQHTAMCSTPSGDGVITIGGGTLMDGITSDAMRLCLPDNVNDMEAIQWQPMHSLPHWRVDSSAASWRSWLVLTGGSVHARHIAPLEVDIAATASIDAIEYANVHRRSGEWVAGHELNRPRLQHASVVWPARKANHQYYG